MTDQAQGRMAKCEGVAMDLTALRQIAEKATQEIPGEWKLGACGDIFAPKAKTFTRGTTRLVVSDEIHRPEEVSNHIATFDPPMVLALLDAIQVLREGLERCHLLMKGAPAIAPLTDSVVHDLSEKALARAEEILKGVKDAAR